MKDLQIIDHLHGAGGGSKGGGGSARAPIEDPNNLQSKAVARIVDLLCEGEIEGLVNGAKSIFLNRTPLQNADGTYNFQGATFDMRNGTADQAPLTGFSDVEQEVSVNTEVKFGTSIFRTITDLSVDAVRVTIGIPQLNERDLTNGDLKGTSVRIQIFVKVDGTTNTLHVDNTITGKTTSLYQKSYRIELTGATNDYTIEVKRVTADSTVTTLQNATNWVSYTTIVDHHMIYPDSAVVGVAVDSELFGGQVPSRAYEIHGTKVQIPSNYDPINGTYTGIWDGTFVVAWTNNPVWCWRDMIVENRYGLGDEIDTDGLDKWSLYTIAQYCDGLVDDGYGGQEPRFTFNAVFTRRQEAITFITVMASVFRAMVYQSSGAIFVAQDAPTTASRLVTPANVEDGLFNYSSSGIKARHTVAKVAWNDPTNFYDQVIEVVEDKAGIARYGYRSTEVLAVGTTNRGQAHRWGKWVLETELHATDVVGYVAGVDHADAVPGEIVKIQDPSYANIRYGGRVVSATTSTVTVDDTITIGVDTPYTFSVLVQTASGSGADLSVSSADNSINSVTTDFVAAGVVVGDAVDFTGFTNLVNNGKFVALSVTATKLIVANSALVTEAAATVSFEVQKVFDTTITDAPGAYSTFNISPSFPKTPVVNAMWAITSAVVAPREFRIIAVTEAAREKFAVLALEYDSTKYAKVEQNIVLERPSFTTFNFDPVVFNQQLVVTEFFVAVGSEIQSAFTVSWDVPQDARITQYLVKIRKPGNENQQVFTTKTASFEVHNSIAGLYSFEVSGVTSVGQTSAPVTVTDFNILGMSAPPSNVTSLIIVIRGSVLFLVWNTVVDLRSIKYEVRKGSTFDGASIIGTTSLTEIAIHGSGTYWVTAKVGAIRSVTPASVITLGTGVVGNVVATYDGTTDNWGGIYAGGANYVRSTNEVQLVSSASFASIPDVSLVPVIWAYNGIDATGVYTIPVASQVDLGVERVSNVRVDMELHGENPYDIFADVPDVSQLPDVAGRFADFVGGYVEARTAPVSGVFGSWGALSPGALLARKYDFRAQLTSSNTQVSAVLDKLVITVDMPDITESLNDLAIPVIGSTLVFSNSYKVVPNVQVTILNGVEGDNINLSAITTTGATVQITNAGSGVARNVNVFVQGY